MKIQIEIDCTPEEARRFIGLPDVARMQERLIKQVEDKLSDTLSSRTPEALLKAWLPEGLPGLDQMQKAFWDNVAGRGDKT